MAETCSKCNKELHWYDVKEEIDGKLLCEECATKVKRRQEQARRKRLQEQRRKQKEEEKRRKRRRKKQKQAIVLTTSYFIEGKRIAEHKGIISAEAVMGVNIFRDFFAEVRDIVGGRAASWEKELTKAKELALDGLRDKAYELGANAIIGVDLDYSQLSGRGAKSSLMVVANGTAVVVEDEQDGITKTNELLSELLDRISDLVGGTE